MSRSVARVTGGARIGSVLTAVVLTGLLLWLGIKTASIWLLLFMSSLLALYLDAVADFLYRRLKLNRRVAFWVGVIGSLGMGVGLVALLVPPVVEQTQQLIGILPSTVRAGQQALEGLVARFPSVATFWASIQHNLLSTVTEQASGLVNGVLPRVFDALAVVGTLFSVIVMAIYLAIEPVVYREWVVALFPPQHRELVRDVASHLGGKLRDYIVAQLLTMVILGALTAVGLKLIGVPYWLTFGVLSAVAAIVPVFGVLLSTTVPALFVLGEPGGLVRALFVLGLGVLIHVIEGNVISPNIMSKRVDLPPVLTMMAVLIFGYLLGPVGLLVAVPLLVAIMVLVQRLLVNRVYEGHGFRRPANDRPLVLRVPVAEGLVSVPDDGVPDLIAIAEASR
ncbi:MAG TPA: AI-2E family transporter [Gemmatimonadaceae bacterium]|nr:AI-2E family transporter [Gemmatimonadaceae bacterium]